MGFSLGGIFTLQLLQKYDDLNIKKAIIWASQINGLNKALLFINSLYKLIIKLNININENLIYKFSNKLDLNVSIPPTEMVKNLNLVSKFKLEPVNKYPVLFIFGNNDPFTKSSAPNIIKEMNINNWSVKSFKNGGHLGTSKDLEKIYKIINSFLNE